MNQGLAWVDAVRVLRALGDVATEKQVILIGGQALNFWHSIYSAVLDSDESLPIASKDIDFCGDKNAVRNCALKLRGKAFFPSMEDSTPSSGKVVFIDNNGAEQTIDFLDCPHGLDLEKVRSTAIPADLLNEDDTESGVRLWVLHPVQCMFSRVKNTMGLPGYDSPHARQQLRLSVTCARLFLESLLDTKEGVRVACDLSEEIYDFCHNTLEGRGVAGAHGVDPFSAVPHIDTRLPEGFRTRRYPQMLDWVTKRRQRASSRR